MNRFQRIVLLTVAATIVVMVLVPPFVMRVEGMVQNLGYAFIADPPNGGYEFYGTVNVELLRLQIAAALIVGGIILLAARSNLRG